jgi:hypothetical protein
MPAARGSCHKRHSGNEFAFHVVRAAAVETEPGSEMPESRADCARLMTDNVNF